MKLNQKLLIAITAGAHFLLAALCVAGDIPGADVLQDILPILSMFLLAPFLSTGVTLVIGGITRFWHGKLSWMALTALGTMLVSFTLVYTGFGEPLMWIDLLPWVVFQYGCSMVTLCVVRLVYLRAIQENIAQMV